MRRYNTITLYEVIKNGVNYIKVGILVKIVVDVGGT